MPSDVTIEEFKSMLDSNEAFNVVDTRPEDEYEDWHIPGAKNYPVRPGGGFETGQFKAETDIAEDERVLAICAEGLTSSMFAKKLSESGFKNSAHIEGGMEAWSQVYDSKVIPTLSDEEVLIQFHRLAKGCLSYLVCSLENETAAAIDPSRHTQEYMDTADEYGVDITHVFDTHIHADHISGGQMLADRVGATYHLGEHTADRGVKDDFRALSENEVVEVGEISIKAIYTPGHTSDMMSYLINNEAVMTGDSLFVDSVGRTELQFGEQSAERGAQLLYESLHKTLLSQPDSITLLPGHRSIDVEDQELATLGSPVCSTVGHLRRENPLLQQDKETFVQSIVEDIPEKPANFDTIININKGEEDADESQATNLELGPNRCAANEGR